MAPVTSASPGASAEQSSQAVQKPASEDSAEAAQEELRSPSRDAVERPGTPDTCLDCNVSPCSLSVSDDPSNLLELDQGVLEDLGQGLATMSLLENGSKGHKKDHAGGEREGSSLNVITLVETSAAAGGQPVEISKVIQEVKEAIMQHRRHPSNLSAPDSEISSSGTFVDKGSCEELSRVGKPEASGQEYSEPEPKSVESQVVAADIIAKTSHDSDMLKPPESAFSTSDISEQASGPINEEDGLHCLACKVTTTSEEQLAIHKEGKRHRRHLAMAELQESPLATADPLESSGGSQDLHCELCQVTAPTPQHREYHLRGQKHQRREKQHQLMEASAELASSSVNALLTETDDEPAAASRVNAEETAEVGAEGRSGSAEIDGLDQRPLKSPFEEFAPPKITPFKPPLQQALPLRNVRFNGSLQSFSEEPEDVADEYGPNPPLPPLGSSVSTSSYKLMSGGSFSSPAAHYCPVCGIIATSGANLEDHYQGRRHARRLQYLSHMPDVERNEHLQRTLTAASSGLFRQGSLVLPSSMDLTAYIGAVAQVHPPPVPPPPPAPLSLERAASLRARRSLNKTLSNQQLSWDSVDGLHLHRENAAATAVSNLDRDEGDALPTEEGNASHEPEQRGKDDEHVLEPQPKCDICGITTTSQAHMEAHRAGRKHRRRVEAAAGRSTVKSSAHYCPLCEISTTSSAHLALHLVGRAHRRRQKALEEGDSLHPVSLLQPTAAVFASDSLELRSDGDAVSSTDIPASSSATAAADGITNGWYAANGPDNSRGPPPLSGRAHSQPESQHTAPRIDTGRATSARAQSTELKAKSPPRSVKSHWPPIPRNMTPIGLPPPPSGYPMGLYPFAQPYFQQGNMSPYPPGTGSHPRFNWWPGAMPHPGQHPQQGRLPFQNGMYTPMGQYPAAGLYPGAPPQYPMMGVSMSGSFPGVRLQAYPGYEQQAYPAAAGASPREWSTQPQQDTYNCEVCNVQTEKLDDLKQHLRGKQHKRRLYTPNKTPWN